MAKILIIDDNEPIRVVCAKVLASLGHVVITVEDARAGIARVAFEDPDLVITDIVMPEFDGFEFIRACHASRPALPILAISGSSIHSDIYLRAAAQFGACGVLIKPFDAERLRQAVAQALAGRNDTGTPQVAGSVAA
jgi:two-component system chemotaxis response regulator CheY